jgi:hypothetical protein
MYAKAKPCAGQGGENAVAVVINEGDAVLFRGDRVFHSVDGFSTTGDDEIMDDSWADALLQGQHVPVGYCMGRLALLFREEREVQNKVVR